MCRLCGLLNGEAHWTEGLRGGLPLRQERLRRLAWINRILAYYRLRLDDFQGAGYVLSNLTGHQEMVTDLGHLWRQAAALAGKRLDPLDPLLLTALATASAE
jgi:hypothetical protein